MQRMVAKANPNKMTKEDAAKMVKGTPLAKVFPFAEEEKEDTVKMRESYFSPREAIFSEMPEQEDEEKDGIDILKKRRGSIFGNVGSSLFGN